MSFAADPFSAATANYVSWLHRVGVEISPSIQIADLRQWGKGRGVVAAQNIQLGDRLFSIPRSALLTAQTSQLYQASELYRQEIEDDNLDSWSALILALLHETSQHDSIWWPYLILLPQEQDFDTLMFWTAEQLKQLQASSITTKIGRIDAEDSFRATIFPLVRAEPSLFGFLSLDSTDGEHALLARLHVLASTIMAYAFDVEPPAPATDDQGFMTDDEGTLPKAMVPLADTLNADAERNNAKLYYEPDGKLVMRAIVDIKQGDELFNDYGPLPRADLLRRYGYMTDNYAIYDSVDIPTEMFLQEAQRRFGWTKDFIMEQLESYFGKLTDGMPDAFELSRTDIDMLDPLDVFPIVKILSPNHAELDAAGTTTTLGAISYLVSILSQRQQQYTTTIAQDKALLTKLSTNPSIREDRRNLMALTLRLSEKELLAAAIVKYDNGQQR